MNPRPVAVTPLVDYNLLVTFRNGERKVYDAAPLLDLPRYQKLRNKGFFSLAKADGMCVYWDDEIDLCPDEMYENSIAMEDVTFWEEFCKNAKESGDEELHVEDFPRADLGRELVLFEDGEG